MAPEHGRSETDLVLPQGEFALVQDTTKGVIGVFVGPAKASLSQTDHQPVKFDERTKRFEPCSLEEAKQSVITAPEGWYAILYNPKKDGGHPQEGTSSNSNTDDLVIGKKVVLPGPVSFALYPGQYAKVVQGHRLRTDEYLLVEIYDEDAAQENIKDAVIKPVSETSGDKKPEPEKDGDPEKTGGEETVETEQSGPVDKEENPPEPASESTPITDRKLTMGERIIIKGTECSFFIPPTGMKVVPVDGNKRQFVRKAVSLENLQYCILVGENGTKRYEVGPDVVFPEPDESFREADGKRIFQAIELDDLRGIYVKVTKDYSEGVEGKPGYQEYKEGQELFITGKDQKIYFERDEHAIIKYGEGEDEQILHFAIAIPKGEARHVLDRKEGDISLVKGPKMFLPDPRNKVVVRRLLDQKTVELLYPGNEEALKYNVMLAAMNQENKRDEIVTDRDFDRTVRRGLDSDEYNDHEEFAMLDSDSRARAGGDAFNRKKSFTPPRTVTLPTKYDGPVTVNVWTGYALNVVDKSGKRTVVEGPGTCMLQYDELPEVLTLSKGTPKSTDRVMKTVYLRVKNNTVSDIVDAETKDLCPVSIRISYRVNFEGDKNKWFNVENYIKLLVEHMRSLLRNAVKGVGIEEFYAQSIDIVRDTVLGTVSEEGIRTGREFDENDMRIYDCEVLDVNILDDRIDHLLREAQQTAVRDNLDLVARERSLEITKCKEKISQEESSVRAQTETKENQLAIQRTKDRLVANLEELKAEAEKERAKLETSLAQEEKKHKIQSSELARKKKVEDQRLAISQAELKQFIEKLEAQVAATEKEAKAVSPDVIAALQAFGDKAIAAQVAESFNVLAMIKGTSVGELFATLLKGTGVGDVLEKNFSSNLQE